MAGLSGHRRRRPLRDPRRQRRPLVRGLPRDVPHRRRGRAARHQLLGGAGGDGAVGIGRAPDVRGPASATGGQRCDCRRADSRSADVRRCGRRRLLRCGLGRCDSGRAARRAAAALPGDRERCGGDPLHFGHHGRSQGRRADSRQPGRGTRIGVRRGRRERAGRRARCAAALPLPGADGQPAATDGRGGQGGVPRDAEHGGTAQGAGRTAHHDIRVRAAVLLPDSRAGDDRSAEGRRAQARSVPPAGRHHPHAAQREHQPRPDGVRACPQRARRAHPAAGDRRLEVRPGDRQGSLRTRLHHPAGLRPDRDLRRGHHQRAARGSHRHGGPGAARQRAEDPAARRRRRGRRDRHSWADRHAGLLQPARGHCRRDARRLVPDRRSRPGRRPRPGDDHRPQERDDRPRLGQEHLPRGNRGALPQVVRDQGDLRDRRRPAR